MGNFNKTMLAIECVDSNPWLLKLDHFGLYQAFKFSGELLEKQVTLYNLYLNDSLLFD